MIQFNFLSVIPPSYTSRLQKKALLDVGGLKRAHDKNLLGSILGLFCRGVPTL